jgi:hypothetical protein
LKAQLSSESTLDVRLPHNTNFMKRAIRQARNTREIPPGVLFTPTEKLHLFNSPKRVSTKDLLFVYIHFLSLFVPFLFWKWTLNLKAVLWLVYAQFRGGIPRCTYDYLHFSTRQMILYTSIVLSPGFFSSAGWCICAGWRQSQ